MPAKDQHSDEYTVRKVVVVAEQHEKKNARRCNTCDDTWSRDQAIPAQHEKRNPFHWQQVQMSSLRVREVIFREGENEAGE